MFTFFLVFSRPPTAIVDRYPHGTNLLDAGTLFINFPELGFLDPPQKKILQKNIFSKFLFLWIRSHRNPSLHAFYHPLPTPTVFSTILVVSDFVFLCLITQVVDR